MVAVNTGLQYSMLNGSSEYYTVVFIANADNMVQH